MPDKTLSSIRAFFDCLHAIAQAPSGKILPGGEIDTILARQLEKSGLISVLAAPTDGSIHTPRITPAGAVALAQWGELLESRSPRTRLLSTLERMFWLAIGALLTNIGYFLS